MVDTHCHLFKEYYEDLSEVIKKMENHIMIVAGVDNSTNKEVVELCKKYDNVYGVIGIHPEEVENVDEESFKLIEGNINNPKIVGIGEIGLDYHWNTENKDLQKEIFIKQIALAQKYNKTIVIHSRDAINDTYEILKEYGNGLKKVIHCFSASYEMAKKFIEIDSMLGIGGVITFKNSKKLIDVVEKIDLKYLLLETDSPYLTPEPFRGKKNEPYNVYYVAKKISEIKGISVENIIYETTSNSISQFDLKINI